MDDPVGLTIVFPVEFPGGKERLEHFLDLGLSKQFILDLPPPIGGTWVLTSIDTHEDSHSRRVYGGKIAKIFLMPLIEVK